MSLVLWSTHLITFVSLFVLVTGFDVTVSVLVPFRTKRFQIHFNIRESEGFTLAPFRLD